MTDYFGKKQSFTISIEGDQLHQSGETIGRHESGRGVAAGEVTRSIAGCNLKSARSELHVQNANEIPSNLCPYGGRERSQ
jgi:hypothetical protein